MRLPSRILTKILFICTLILMLILSYCILVKQIKKENVNNLNNKIISMRNNQKYKYILQWISPKNILYVYMGKHLQDFNKRKCPHTNCIVTDDRNYLGDYTKFDVIAFAVPGAVKMNPTILPTKRSPHQKFVFASLESPVYYPLCSKMFDDYFNWTWTFKLNSDAHWGYIVVKDMNNNVVGPKIDMHWIKFEDMDPVGDELKNEIKTKTKAAAWFVSNCLSKGGREWFVETLQNKLKKYSLTIDIYGGCGPLRCPQDSIECFEMIKKDYYFYLSFENSLTEDYVTEKLLTSLKHTTVPIVYGGANYTRFMPDGIYLNALELGVDKLAEKMNELIQNPAQYAEYFRWKKYYSYHYPEEMLEMNDYCRFCDMLFDEELVNKSTVYHNFSQWWDTPGECS